jgi:serine/threonine protein kinase
VHFTQSSGRNNSRHGFIRLPRRPPAHTLPSQAENHHHPQMAVAEGTQHFQVLRLNTGRQSPRRILRSDGDTSGNGMWTPDRYDFLNHDSVPSYPMRRVGSGSEHTSMASMTIPNGQTVGEGTPTTGGSLASGLQQSQRSSPVNIHRRTSVTFDPMLRFDSGARHPLEEPLQRPGKPRLRGRSLLQAMKDDMDRQQCAPGASNDNQYDTTTGESLTHDRREDRDEAYAGEIRRALLPATVDELAQESQTDLPDSMTSAATLSPSLNEVRTPLDNQTNAFLLSPTAASPIIHPHSYEEGPPYSRYTERSHTAAADFFGRAGSHRKSPQISTGRTEARRSMSSTKSPKSAASSFLAAFSRSRGSRNGNGSDSHDNRPVSPDAEGQTVGDDYVLGKQIGFGGFSVVKEAFRMNSNGSQRQLAVKIVRRNIQGKSEIENEQAQAEFDHEIELWRFLKHPRILPLEAVYKTDDATFCFIPFNKGGTLFDLVRVNRSGLPAHLAKRYTYQLSTAIRYLHEDARVAHRDIKLENCLLDTSVDPANVRLCDFGMSEWITNDSPSSFDDPPSPNINCADRPPQRNMGPSDTSTSAFAGGSLEYAAPEIVNLALSHNTPGQQREAQRGVVSPASDIWALGVCIYTLVVGSRPFQDAFQPRVTMAILNGEWDRERLREKGGEDALELVMGCLEMDLRERWDINEVLGSAWLRDEVERNGDQEGGYGGWGL